MTGYKFGDIVLIEFPKTDVEASIKRPAVVLLDIGDEDIMAARITTHPVRGKGDLAVEEWESVGLRATSTIRISKIATNKSLVIRKLGELTEKGSESVRRLFSVLLD